jgi:hypothetical protein
MPKRQMDALNHKVEQQALSVQIGHLKLVVPQSPKDNKVFKKWS